MKFTFRTSPNYRQPLSTRQIMAELNLALLCVVGFSFYFNYTSFGSDYGFKVLAIVGTAIVSAYLVEIVWALLTKKSIKEHLAGSFPLTTPLIFALICPIGISLYAIAISTIFAVFFGKLIFGGFGSNIFNPAAVGRAVVFAAFSGSAVTYLGDAISSATPTSYMANALGWVVNNEVLGQRLLEKFGGLSNMFFGFYQGAIGETSACLILILGIFLIIRKVIDWRVPVFYIGTIFVLSLGIALMNGTGLWYPFFSVLTGGVMFGAIFMLTDPVTNPTHPVGRIIFAIGAGIITMLIRIKANLPEGVLYSILIMNMLSPLIDSFLTGNQIAKLKTNILKIAGVVVIGFGSVILAASVITPKDPRVFVYGSANDLLQWRANIIDVEKTSEGRAYTVKADGFYTTSDLGEEMNVFKVYVNETDEVITKVEVVSFGDTPSIANKVNDEAFLNQFVGQSIKRSNAIEMVEDVVSGATNTAKSVVRAVRAITDLYGSKTEVLASTDTEYRVKVTYDSYYIAYGLTHEGEQVSLPNTVIFTFDKATKGVIGWEVETWGDSKGMDNLTRIKLLKPLFDTQATFDQVFKDDVITSVTYSGFATSIALKSAMLAIEDLK